MIASCFKQQLQQSENKVMYLGGTATMQTESLHRNLAKNRGQHGKTHAQFDKFSAAWVLHPARRETLYSGIPQCLAQGVDAARQADIINRGGERRA
jgi:hypothetical protein